MSVSLHPTAIVAPGAQLDDDVEVGPYATIGAKVRIGSGTRIGAYAFVDGNTTIGEGNTIFHHASVGAVPQDLKFHGEDSVLEIGNRNIIREFATVHLGTENGGMVTRLGDANLVMNYSHVGHDCILGDGNILANGAQLGGHVVVENFVRLGALAGVHQFTRLGTGAIIGAGSMVTQDIAPYCTANGDRAHLFGLNTEGLRRMGTSDAAVKSLKAAYRLVFRSGLRVPEAAARVRTEVESCPEVDHFLSFIEASERGVARERTR